MIADDQTKLDEARATMTALMAHGEAASIEEIRLPRAP